jgi:hypothetical protein
MPASMAAEDGMRRWSSSTTLVTVPSSPRRTCMFGGGGGEGTTNGVTSPAPPTAHSIHNASAAVSSFVAQRDSPFCAAQLPAKGVLHPPPQRGRRGGLNGRGPAVPARHTSAPDDKRIQRRRAGSAVARAAQSQGAKGGPPRGQPRTVTLVRAGGRAPGRVVDGWGVGRWKASFRGRPWPRQAQRGPRE